MTRAALVATGRGTFDQAAGRSVHDRARRLMGHLGADVLGPTGLVEDAATAARAAVEFRLAEADVAVLLCATFADAGVALAAFGHSTRPVWLWAVPDPALPGDRLSLNSLCGANLAAHALVREGVEVRFMLGNPEEPALEAQLSRALRGEVGPARRPRRAGGELAARTEVAAALGALTGRSIGVAGEAPAGFTTCLYEPAWLRATLGLEVRAASLESTFDRINAVEGARRALVVKDAGRSSPSLRELREQEVDLFAATAVALQDWAGEAGLDALALRCWPEFPQQLGICPCSALGRVAGSGRPTACEADVNGAATMLLMQALGGGTTYLADTVRLDEEDNLVTFWHCGLAPDELSAAQPTQLWTHCNRGIGVAGNFSLRPGRVTLARISSSRDGYRLLLSGGEGLAGPNRFQGNSLDVLLDSDAHQFVWTLIERGFEHHVVLAWRELRPQLRRAADLLGLELVEC